MQQTQASLDECFLSKQNMQSHSLTQFTLIIQSALLSLIHPAVASATGLNFSVCLKQDSGKKY